MLFGGYVYFGKVLSGKKDALLWPTTIHQLRCLYAHFVSRHGSKRCFTPAAAAPRPCPHREMDLSVCNGVQAAGAWLAGTSGWLAADQRLYCHPLVNGLSFNDVNYTVDKYRPTQQAM